MEQGQQQVKPPVVNSVEVAPEVNQEGANSPEKVKPGIARRVLRSAQGYIRNYTAPLVLAVSAATALAPSDAKAQSVRLNATVNSGSDLLKLFAATAALEILTAKPKLVIEEIPDDALEVMSNLRFAYGTVPFFIADMDNPQNKISLQAATERVRVTKAGGDKIYVDIVYVKNVNNQPKRYLQRSLVGRDNKGAFAVWGLADQQL